jgi:histidyl-tRNA synthetase
MNDVLPSDNKAWQYVEKILTSVVSQYGYQQIRFPIVEKTELFKRSIGELTDIVQKEMYSFEDSQNGDQLTLRPEGTAPCVRACISNKLLYNKTPRLWYLGPFFRHENPQKGRYRQFHQFGIEVFGYASIDIELELLAMSNRLWQAFGLSDYCKLQINTIGTLEERMKYQQELTRYFESHREQLDTESLTRLEKNPLRILDSKNPKVQEIVAGAPKLHQHLSEATLTRFNDLCAGLETLGIAYTVEPTLVRGLDYYSHTVFEWVTDKLGAQGTVLAGGRYDGLVAQFGEKPTPAAGFALGFERLVLILETLALIPAEPDCDIYVVIEKEVNTVQAFALLEKLRLALPTLKVKVDLAASSSKSQLKRANGSGASYALLFMNDNPQPSDEVILKGLRGQFEQQNLTLDAIVSHLKKS